MAKISEYIYVDVWHSDKNGKSSPWKRIAIDEVKKFQQEEALNFNCFATIQQFANKVRTKGEDFLSPLYFDLDWEKDPEVARVESIKIVDYFTNELGLMAEDIKIYFSGSKGFHLLIDRVSLDIEPRKDLHKVYKYIAGFLRYRLGTPEEPLKSIDLVVYSNPRMLRLPNSVHQKTRLFKTRLTIKELQTMSLEQIKELATEPRRDTDFTEKASQKRTAAVKFYERNLAEYEQARATTVNNYSKKYNFLFEKDNPPECVKDILNNGWKKEGDRNQATVQLACYFKAAGYSVKETLEILKPWVIKYTSAKSSYQKEQRISNTVNVIDSIYNNENDYSFACAFIRSLHGEKKAGSNDYERVKCNGHLCHVLKENIDEKEDPIHLHLAETGNAKYVEKLVSTNVMIAGKRNSPYIVPSKIEYVCGGKDNCNKNGCPLYYIPSGTGYKDLSYNNRELIEMCNMYDANIKGLLKSLSGIYSCRKFDVNIVAFTNVEELIVIPKVEDSTEIKKEEIAARYVTRKIYMFGDISFLQENKYYKMTGYVFPHPKNQEGTILVKKAEPLQDVVTGFKLTDEINNKLNKFKPESYTLEGIHNKLSKILTELTHNVTRIVERDEALLTALLTYHSVLRIKVPWDSEPIRGWVESIIIGDTATGKSALLEKLQNYTALGTRVNAESTTRTGLTYKMEQLGSGGSWFIVWGAWPLADRELIWIDECTGISKAEYGQMTMARSEGKLEVKRAVTAETPSRVRAILTGNVPEGNRLSDYGQGCESLKDIFNNEDIRRFDLAVFMKSTDVDSKKYNKELEPAEKIIESEDLKNNILFAWSRASNQIIISKKTIETILEVSSELSTLYGDATDVPLVSPSDQRNKITRLAVSLAAITHSVDSSSENIIVYPSHVLYIKEFIKAVYNVNACGLNYYAKLVVKEEELTDEKYEKINSYLKELHTLKSKSKFAEFISLFSTQNHIRIMDVETMLSIDKEEAKSIINLLAKLRMILISSHHGLKKTARFNSYISKAFEKGVLDDLEMDLI